MVVRVGDIYLNERNANGASPMDIPIEEIISHPQYKSSPLINDVALLRLKTPVTFTGMYFIGFLVFCLRNESTNSIFGCYRTQRNLEIYSKIPYLYGNYFFISPNTSYMSTERRWTQNWPILSQQSPIHRGLGIYSTKFVTKIYYLRWFLVH